MNSRKMTKAQEIFPENWKEKAELVISLPVLPVNFSLLRVLRK